MKFVHFINTHGNDMWVAEDRVEEYKAAGHRLAAEPKAEKPTEKPKRTRKKRGVDYGIRNSC